MARLSAKEARAVAASSATQTKRQEQVGGQALVPRLPRHFETFREERARGRMVSAATRQITERVECARNQRFVAQVFAEGEGLTNQVHAPSPGHPLAWRRHRGSGGQIAIPCL